MDTWRERKGETERGSVYVCVSKLKWLWRMCAQVSRELVELVGGIVGCERERGVSKELRVIVLNGRRSAVKLLLLFYC